MIKTNTIVALVLIIALGGLGYYAYSKFSYNKKVSSITNFEECVALNNQVQLSYPAICVTPDGRSFREDISDDEHSAPPINNLPSTKITDIAVVEQKLKDMGISYEVNNIISQDQFDPTVPFPTAQYKIDAKLNVSDPNNLVSVYVFENVAVREKAQSQISKEGDSIDNKTYDWVSTPHFYSLDAVLVQYIGDNKQIIEALENLLGKQVAGR